MRRRLVSLAAVLVACSNQPSGASSVGALHALYQGEADEGRVVARSAARAEIVSFADQVITDDSSADAARTRAAASESIAPNDSPASVGIRGNAARELASLGSETGSALGVSFVSFAIARDEEALALVDHLLARYASDSLLRARVVSAREMVTDHLAHANALALALAR